MEFKLYTMIKTEILSQKELLALPKNGGETYNRLIFESSPYLLQHAKQAINWYPWRQDAFELAKMTDKPIFLSVGYSACHWCHVMSSESFDNAEIADYLNNHFICIKCDREEHPAIDELYLLATQILTGKDGWPNSLWLTPDRRPWHAGTYFPKDDKPGHIGFLSLLKNLKEAWHTRRDDITFQSDRVTEALHDMAAATDSQELPPKNLLNLAIQELESIFDTENGGLKGAPKFPPHSTLRLWLYHAKTHNSTASLHKLTETLDAMGLGGIYDHIGGGFHRYSIDEKWGLPHFEKMLCDNAQLARIYAETYAHTKNPLYRKRTEEILLFVTEELRHNNGCFYTGIDADSDGEEGLFYTWTQAELNTILSTEEQTFIKTHFSIATNGNFLDAVSGQKTGRNILSLSRPMTYEETAQFEPIKTKLLKARNQRNRPILDNKIMGSWNALMIEAFCIAAQSLDTPIYQKIAEKAMIACLDMLFKNGVLKRYYTKQRAVQDAILQDYSYMASACLTLYEHTKKSIYLDRVTAMLKTVEKEFSCLDHGGFFHTAKDYPYLLVRMIDGYDKSEPSANGILATVYGRMYMLFKDDAYFYKARNVVQRFSADIQKQSRGYNSLILAFIQFCLPQSTPPTGPIQASIKGIGSPVLTLHLTIEEGYWITVPINTPPIDIALTGDTSYIINHIKWPSPTRKKQASKHVSIYRGKVTIHIHVSEIYPPKEKQYLSVSITPCSDVESTDLSPISLSLLI